MHERLYNTLDTPQRTTTETQVDVDRSSRTSLLTYHHRQIACFVVLLRFVTDR